MRPAVVGLATLLLGLTGATPEARTQNAIVAEAVSLSAAVLEKADQLLALAAPSTGDVDNDVVLTVPSDDGDDNELVLELQPEPARDVSNDTFAWQSPPTDDDTSGSYDPHSIVDLCRDLLVSAQNNDLPVPFFANLIWQESRLRHDAVSPVGAQGIAQFMPRVAAAAGLRDPFDPHQALPSSARLLRSLRLQFGNLGYVAAAYNAGPHRVSQWLVHRGTLPRETQIYVVRVTGRSIEEWQKTPPEDSALRFARLLPCRELPAFSDLEQAQIRVVRAQSPEPPEPRPAPAPPADSSAERTLAGNSKSTNRSIRMAALHKAIHNAHRRRREATRHQRAHERRRTAEVAAKSVPLG